MLLYVPLDGTGYEQDSMEALTAVRRGLRARGRIMEAEDADLQLPGSHPEGRMLSPGFPHYWRGCGEGGSPQRRLTPNPGPFTLSGADQSGRNHGAFP